MNEVGTAVGWTIYEQDGRYFVRIEQVVAMLSNSPAARDLLAYVLHVDTGTEATDAENPL